MIDDRWWIASDGGNKKESKYSDSVYYEPGRQQNLFKDYMKQKKNSSNSSIPHRQQIPERSR